MVASLSSIYSEEYKQLIAELVAARKEAKVTQVELAALLDVDQPFISKYERRERRLDVVEYVKICRILGFKSMTLVGMIEQNDE